MKLTFRGQNKSKMRAIRFASVLVAATTLAGCLGDGHAAPEYPVFIIRVNPPASVLQTGQTATLVATAYDDANNRVPGKKFVWASTDSATVLTLPGGVIKAMKTGTATVSATVDGITANVPVVVQ